MQDCGTTGLQDGGKELRLYKSFTNRLLLLTRNNLSIRLRAG
jgi:hypothetical protein